MTILDRFLTTLCRFSKTAMGNTDSQPNIDSSAKLHTQLTRTLPDADLTDPVGHYAFKLQGLGYIPARVIEYIRLRYRVKDQYRLFIIINKLLNQYYTVQYNFGNNVYNNIIKYCDIQQGFDYVKFDYSTLPLQSFPHRIKLSISNTTDKSVDLFETLLFTNTSAYYDENIGYDDVKHFELTNNCEYNNDYYYDSDDDDHDTPQDTPEDEIQKYVKLALALKEEAEELYLNLLKYPPT